MAFCSQCGKPVVAGAKFCANCGQATGSSSPTHPSRPAATAAATNAASTAAFTPSGVDPSIRSSVSQTLFVVAQPMMADFQRLLNAHRLTPLGLVSGSDVDELRKRAQNEVTRHQGRLRYVCILGDWALVPPYEMPCPLGGDSALSDAPYAGGASGQAKDPMEFIPRASVSRVPVRDMGIIERVLFQPMVSRTPSEAFAFSVTAQNG